MESFFDFIVGNIFIIIIIVGAIINFLSKGKQEEKKQSRTPERPQPAVPDVRETKTYEKARETLHEVRKKIEREAEISTRSIEEQVQEQYDRLRSQYQTSQDLESDSLQPKYRQSGLEKQVEAQRTEEGNVRVNVNVDKKLTHKGLIESVIMAEVLGPPRALNPYQNIIMKRKQR